MIQFVVYSRSHLWSQMLICIAYILSILSQRCFTREQWLAYQKHCREVLHRVKNLVQSWQPETSSFMLVTCLVPQICCKTSDSATNKVGFCLSCMCSTSELSPQQLSCGPDQARNKSLFSFHTGGNLCKAPDCEHTRFPMTLTGHYEKLLKLLVFSRLYTL